jgi:hypothetical protein
MTGIAQTTNGVTVTWDGPSGYYQLFQKQSLTSGTWQPLGRATNLSRMATITIIYSNDFFRVAGPPPQYIGSQACAECHGNIHDTELNTKHASAFQTLKQIHQETNSSCLPCHTVGYGLPTGFRSEAATPQLEGVQCENCHGPAGNHAVSGIDSTVRPRSEIAAQVCGGCHNGSQDPTFDEWHSSVHAGVVQDFNATNNIDSCGRCHSGTVRISLLNSRPLPYGDANIGIVCVVCHDPHKTNGFPAQIRNPLSSTNDYSISTSIPFTNQYNPNINLCGQCHNDRGAAYTSSSRPPHHSPQYNILTGTVGELASGVPPFEPGSHALLITNQCADCHMQHTAPTAQTGPSITGHTFTVDTFALCLQCHPLPADLVDFTQGVVSNRISQIVGELNLWAQTKGPPALYAKYGNLAWEYTTPGELSASGSGPNSSEQAQIPVNIQKARFDLYLVYNDGSFGVHNAQYILTLLDTAEAWVTQELSR